MTLIAGVAIFAYVRVEAGISELSYAQSVGQTDNYLAERFEVTLVSFTSGSLTIYVYTNGQIPSQFTQVEVYGPTRASMDVIYTPSQVTVVNPSSCATQVKASSSNESPMLGTGTGTFSVSVNNIASVALTLPTCTGLSFQSGNTYFVILLGQYGNTATYFQAM